MPPDDRKFGIKLFGHCPLLSDLFRQVMNFSPAGHGQAIAENIPVGHRSLVYQTDPTQRFTRAIEFTGDLAQGQAIFHRYRISPEVLKTIDPMWLQLFRPIRILAEVDCTIDRNRAPSLEEIARATGFHFTPVGFPMQYITQQSYYDIFKAIKWDWMLADAIPGG